MELLAVIVILGIIAAIAIPAIGNIIANSEAKAEVADAMQVMSAANIYFADNPSQTSFAKANAGDYIEGVDNLESFTVTKASPNTIVFKGKRVSTTTGLTLDQLSKATVSEGTVKSWPAATN